MPGKMGIELPSVPIFAKASRLGVLAASKFGRSARLQRQSAQAVGHQEHDLGVVLDLQFANQLLDFHGRIPPECWGREFQFSH